MLKQLLRKLERLKHCLQEIIVAMEFVQKTDGYLNETLNTCTTLVGLISPLALIAEEYKTCLELGKRECAIKQLVIGTCASLFSKMMESLIEKFQMAQCMFTNMVMMLVSYLMKKKKN